MRLHLGVRTAEKPLGYLEWFSPTDILPMPTASWEKLYFVKYPTLIPSDRARG